MADTKITNLTAAAAALLTHEYPVNEAGADKKVSGTQQSALYANPASNEGDDLGTAALRWLNAFLGNGGKIDFNNGNFTLTHAAGKLTLAGGGLVLAQGGTGQAPLVFNPGGSLMTTPDDGAIEMDANALYGCTDAGNRGNIPIEHFIRLNSNRAALANNTNFQAIFDSPTNGRLTLETGLYLFDGIIAVEGMSGTTGNGKFSIIGAGTATIGTPLWIGDGWDTTAEQTAFSSGGGWHKIATQTIANVVTTQTALGMCAVLNGTFAVTAAGTIIPSFALTTAIGTAVIQAGSWFKCRRLGSTSLVSIGQWD